MAATALQLPGSDGWMAGYRVSPLMSGQKETFGNLLQVNEESCTSWRSSSTWLWSFGAPKNRPCETLQITKWAWPSFTSNGFLWDARCRGKLCFLLSILFWLETPVVPCVGAAGTLDHDWKWLPEGKNQAAEREICCGCTAWQERSRWTVKALHYVQASSVVSTWNEVRNIQLESSEHALKLLGSMSSKNDANEIDVNVVQMEFIVKDFDSYPRLTVCLFTLHYITYYYTYMYIHTLLTLHLLNCLWW